MTEYIIKRPKKIVLEVNKYQTKNEYTGGFECDDPLNNRSPDIEAARVERALTRIADSHKEFSAKSRDREKIINEIINQTGARERIAKKCWWSVNDDLTEWTETKVSDLVKDIQENGIRDMKLDEDDVRELLMKHRHPRDYPDEWSEKRRVAVSEDHYADVCTHEPTGFDVTHMNSMRQPPRAD